jgi:membrane-associated protease RseP (regulator of RpoE activity)
MIYGLGVFLFALGILLSVCLHEAGHMLTAKRFGMKVTKYFVGFGPTLWSFRRGETEYGVKAIPAGGFVKIVGMTPLEDDLAEADQPRAFWRQKVWKRTIVLSAGSMTHFVIGFVLLYIALVGFGITQQKDPATVPAQVEAVSPCVVVANDVDSTGEPRACVPGKDPESPAQRAGLEAGDVITSIGGHQIRSYQDFRSLVRAQKPGPVAMTITRAGVARTLVVPLIAVQRPPLDAPAGSKRVETVSFVGITGHVPTERVRYGALAGVAAAGKAGGGVFTGTFKALGAFPQKVPNLIKAIDGGKRDPNGPVSVVGASRIGGEVLQKTGFEGTAFLLSLLASLNIFIGIFNLFPLLPLDGGHIAIVWFERVRSWWAARRGRPDPGRVDYAKLMPVTIVVILVFGSVSLLAVAADIVNPISLFP